MARASGHGEIVDDVAWTRIERTGPCAVVAAGGEIDLATCDGLRKTANLAIGCSRWVVVDLHAVTFIDAAGLGVLVGARRRAHDQGRAVALVDPSDLVRKRLELAGLDTDFVLYPTREAACTALAEDPTHHT